MSSFGADARRDQTRIEPDIGIRPSERGALPQKGRWSSWAKRPSVRERWGTQKIGWGVLYDAERGTRTSPEAKLLKAHHLVNFPDFLKKPVQQRRGNSTDARLRGRVAGKEAPWAEPEARQEDAREELWDSIGRQRIMVAGSAMRTSEFTSGFEQARTAAERISLPGSLAAVSWVIDDATPGRLGTIDWTREAAASRDVGDSPPRRCGPSHG